MHEGIYIAASAGTKQGRKMEVIAQNLANVNSTGYKGDRLAFKELMSPFPSDKGQEPTKDLLQQTDKTNSNVSYVAVTEQYTDHEQGNMKQTNSELDIALDGPGYFSVSTKEGIRYTRNGNFRLNTENQIVNQKGQPVLSEQGEPIVITAEGTEISIDGYGNIFVGSGERSANIGKIRFVDFDNKQTLEKIGDGLFYQSDTEAEEKLVNDTKLRQGFLEGSNVTATDEMTNMISTVRLFETYQKIIQSIDNMNEQSVNSIGRIG
jgi:flagellar basal-body rod protein FlgF